MILAPRALLRVADQIGARNVMVMPDLSPAHAGEEAFRTVRVDAARQAVGLAVVNPLHVVARMQVVP